ncbi:MAG: response regulator [Segetibacter sp.]|nr:response regulator [Segetibacter sp.]
MEFGKVKEVDKTEIKILVVDDREDNILSIETILEREGYNIVKALSGRGALKILLNQHDFTLILMDVQMPDMNGFETAALIYEREKLRHIPIIFITAHDYGEENIFKGYKTGGVDYIYKPYNPDLLRYKVSVYVELYRKNHLLLQQERILKAVNKNLEKEIEERKVIQDKIIQLNRQLIENNARLKTTNEELDRFAYVASHDLQEPLRKILIFSDKVSSKFLEEGDLEVKSYLQKIARSSQRMQQLINDLLKFSRHTNDDFCFEETDLNEIVKEVLVDLELEIQQKNAEIFTKKLPVIRAIPTQISQLFQNIISNSLKFCKGDCVPRIFIETEEIRGSEIDGIERELENEKFLRIHFRDNGIGFDEKYAEDIFVVFKRLHSYHEFEGTGIGLSICKKIVEKHNGNIHVKSKLNEGSTFVVTLPLTLPVLEKDCL